MKLSGIILLIIASTITQASAYSGGSGTPEDPYQIATAEDLIMLGETPDDYDKHFVLTADIDLDPNLPGRKVFDRAVIAPDLNDVEPLHQGKFTGSFNGNDHVIANMVIAGGGYVGLFGSTAWPAEISNLGLEMMEIKGVSWVGGVAGVNTSGCIRSTHCTGTVRGNDYTGGLVGRNEGNVIGCYSLATVTGVNAVGGLVGINQGNGYITCCYVASTVSGQGTSSGGLAGLNWMRDSELVPDLPTLISNCYAILQSNSQVSGPLVGWETDESLWGLRLGRIMNCYASCRSTLVSGFSDISGIEPIGDDQVSNCFYDIEACGTPELSPWGDGILPDNFKTTGEMTAISTFINAGWDFLGESNNGLHEIWEMPKEGGCPVLSVFNSYTLPDLNGTGRPEDPYLISNVSELSAMIYYCPSAHYCLTASIDLSGITWNTSVITKFSGMFD